MSSFSFPTFKQMYGGERRLTKRLRSFFRYYFYRLTQHRQVQHFETYLTQNPQWQPIFTSSPYRANALLAKYCDRRFHSSQRNMAIQANFDVATHCFGQEICANLIEKKTLLLASLTENWGIYLNINNIDPFEGFFSLNIKNTEGRSVYDASFSFLSQNRLLIASVQGPSTDDSQDFVKLATKQLHGMRPMFMLINAFKTMAQVFHCELLGITHKNQAKYRWNDHSKLLFNYDEFWQENGGKLNADGYWTLPLEIESKPLEEIQSKKRSMYRKRYEMFDVLAQDLAQFFKKDKE